MREHADYASVVRRVVVQHAIDALPPQASRAKASREECERAERDLSDLRDQNAAQSTALIKATDTAQADRAFVSVWKSKFYGAFVLNRTRHTG